MVSQRFVKLNRKFISICGYWASLSGEFNLPHEKLIGLMIGWLTMVWSLIIIVTCSSRLAELTFKSKSPFQQLNRTLDQQRPTAWSELDDQPNLQTFGSLHYRLVIVSACTTLIWRLYLVLSRRAQSSEQVVSDPFDGRQEAVDFFLNGPCTSAVQYETTEKLFNIYFRRNCSHLPGFQRTFHGDEQTRDRHRNRGQDHDCGHEEDVSVDRFGNDLDKGEPADAAAGKTGGPLSGAHEQPRGHQSRLRTYRIPIGSADFLLDKSESRWLNIARHVHAYALLSTICAVLITCLILSGLSLLKERFRVTSVVRSSDNGEPRGEGGEHKLIVWLGVYEIIEQVYIISQLYAFLIATNVFVALFHQDLVYKAQLILDELQLLICHFSSGLIETVPLKRVYWIQLRIWSYFNQISIVDRLISRYAVVLVIQLSIVMAFCQSFLWLNNAIFKRGIIAAISSNLLSLVYLHAVSEHLERKSRIFWKNITTILAAEQKAGVKREWQRLLKAFFQPTHYRTFTIGGMFPANFGTFLRVSPQRIV